MFFAAIALGLSPRAMDTINSVIDTMNQCVEKGPHLKGISSSHVLPLRWDTSHIDSTGLLVYGLFTSEYGDFGKPGSCKKVSYLTYLGSHL